MLVLTISLITATLILTLDGTTNARSKLSCRESKASPLLCTNQLTLMVVDNRTVRRTHTSLSEEAAAAAAYFSIALVEKTIYVS